MVLLLIFSSLMFLLVVQRFFSRALPPLVGRAASRLAVCDFFEYYFLRSRLLVPQLFLIACFLLRGFPDEGPLTTNIFCVAIIV